MIFNLATFGIVFVAMLVQQLIPQPQLNVPRFLRGKAFLIDADATGAAPLPQHHLELGAEMVGEPAL